MLNRPFPRIQLWFSEEPDASAPPLHESFTDTNECKKAQTRVQARANIPRALPQTQKRQVANDPLASRIPTGSVCARDWEKQQALICFHALTESNWGSDGSLTLQAEWGEASG